VLVDQIRDGDPVVRGQGHRGSSKLSGALPV
jgi:hypothetical protein